MPDCATSWTTYAGTANRTSTALASPVTTNVPDSALRTGINTVAVGFHLDHRFTPDSILDLELDRAAN